MTLKEILEKRGEIYTAMQTLQKKAESENRDFNAEEQEQWDELSCSYDFASERADALRASEQSGNRSDDGPRPRLQVEGNRTLPRGNSEQRSIRTRDGHEVPVLSPEQRFSDFIEHDPSEPRNVDREKLWRGILSGDWSNAGAERRLMSGAIDTGGGYFLPPAAAGPALDYARNSAKVLAAGARTLPMPTREMTIPVLESDPTAYLKPEGAELEESEATVGSWRLSATTCAILLPLSMELVEDATGLVDMVEQAIGSSIGLRIDHQSLYGCDTSLSGSGIRYQSGVHEDSTADAINMDDITSAVATIRGSNGEPNAYITSPQLQSYIEKLKDGDAKYVIAAPPPAFSGLTPHITNQAVGTDGSADLFIGDFTQLIVGMRSELRLEVFRSGSGPSSGSAVSKGLVYLRGYARFDTVATRPTWFHRHVDLPTS